MAGVVLGACLGHHAPRDDDARTLTFAADSAEKPPSSEGAECRACCGTDVPPAPIGDDIVHVGGGTKPHACMLDLLSDVAAESGADLVLDDACRRRLEETQVFICFDYKVRRSELTEFLTAVLSFSDFALVPSEAASPGARPRWKCIDRRPAAVPQRAAGPDRGE